jgi:hypothetical protein
MLRMNSDDFNLIRTGVCIFICQKVALVMPVEEVMLAL